MDMDTNKVEELHDDIYRDFNKPADKIDMELRFFQPWSTFVMETVLPPPVLEAMIEISNTVAADPERLNFGHKLEGQIEDEFIIPPELLKQRGVISFLLDMCRKYITYATIQSNPHDSELILNQEQGWLPKIISMWMVSQKDNEYNPVHVHTGCSLSAIMYLKIPEYLPSRKSQHPYYDGSIAFSNNTSNNEWSKSQLQMQPYVGQLFIFPSTLQHQVYPFRTADGKGERRSVSFNATFSSKAEQNKLSEQESAKNFKANINS